MSAAAEEETEMAAAPETLEEQDLPSELPPLEMQQPPEVQEEETAAEESNNGEEGGGEGDPNSGDGDDDSIQKPKSRSVKQALAQFDKPQNTPLMPDKSISPVRLSLPKSGKGEEASPPAPAFPAEEPITEAPHGGDSNNNNSEEPPAEENEEKPKESSALNVSTDSSEQYVPESLSSFVEQTANTLDVTTQEEFWDNTTPRRSTEGDGLSAVSPSSTLVTDASISDRPPTEDDSDRRLKKDLLTKYDNAAAVPKEIKEDSALYAGPDFAAVPKKGENGSVEEESAAAEDAEPEPSPPAPTAEPDESAAVDEPEEPEPNPPAPSTEQEEVDNVPEENNVAPQVAAEPELQEPPDLKQEVANWMDDGELVDTGTSHEIGAAEPSEHSEVAAAAAEVPFDGKTPNKDEKERPPSPPTAHPMEYSPRRSSPKPSPGGKTPNIKNTGKGNGKKQTMPAELGAPSLDPKEPALGSPSSVSRKSVGSGISSNSRLLQPTVSASRRFSNRSAGSDRKKSSEAEVLAGRDLAKERVKNRKMKEAEQNQQNSPTSTRSIRMSPEEGHARARARVKIRQMQEQEMGGGGKENAQNRRPSSSSSAKKQPRPLTVPQGPRLSTSIRASEKRNIKGAASAMGARPDDQSVTSSLASRSVTSRQRNNPNLRGDQSITSASSKSTRRSVTVPQGPRFTLDAKYGEKVSSTASRRGLGQKERDDRSISSRASNSTLSSKRSITVPVAPKFTLDAKYGEKRSSPTKPDIEVGSYAASARSEKSESSKSTWHKDRKTVPVAPKFHTTSHRKPPKSQEERDLEEMEKYNVKARRPTDGESVRSGQSSVASGRRQITVPVAPKFNTTSQRRLPKSQEQLDLEERERYYAQLKTKPRTSTKGSAPRFHTTSTRKITTKSKEEKDEEELKKQFKARPMPKTTSKSGSTRQVVYQSKELKDQEEMKKQFKARPMPKSASKSGSTRQVVYKSREQKDQEEMKKQFKARPMPKHGGPSAEKKSTKTEPAPPIRELGFKTELEQAPPEPLPTATAGEASA